MRYIVAEIVAVAPALEWAPSFVETLRMLHAEFAPLKWSWEAEIGLRGREEFREKKLTDRSFSDMLDSLARMEIGSIDLHAGPPIGRSGLKPSPKSAPSELVIRASLFSYISPYFEPHSLSRRLFPGLPHYLESDQQCRLISIALHLTPEDAPPKWFSALVDRTKGLFLATGACWASIGDCPTPIGTTGHATHHEWIREAAPIIRYTAPGIAWSIILGRGHIEVMGGESEAERRLASFDHAWLPSDENKAGLLVQLGPRPPAARPSIEKLRQALEPILMQAPLDPAPCLLLVAPEWDGGDEDLSKLRTHRLLDGTIAVEVFDRPIRRGDPEESTLLAGCIQQVYQSIREIDRIAPWAAPPLYIPRLLGPWNYLRMGTQGRPAGLAVWDTGEPFEEDIPLTLAYKQPPSASRLLALSRALEQWASRVGVAQPEVEVIGHDFRFRVSTSAKEDDLLLLVLTLDRFARARSRTEVEGIVVGVPFDSHELYRRWRDGEPLYRVPPVVTQDDYRKMDRAFRTNHPCLH